MSAGEAKPSAAIGSLKRPGHMLGVTCRHALSDSRIAAVSTVTALHGFLGGHVGKNRRHALHPRRKAHMKIPLIIRLEGLNSLCDGVLWELREIGGPVRVHRPMCFETAALPRDEFLITLVGGGLHGVVNGEETDTLVH